MNSQLNITLTEMNSDSVLQINLLHLISIYHPNFHHLYLFEIPLLTYVQGTLCVNGLVLCCFTLG